MLVRIRGIQRLFAPQWKRQLICIFAFACLIPLASAAVVPKAQDLPYQDEVVTASMPYNGAAGQAIVRSYLQPPGARRGIFVVLGGYDPNPIAPCQVGVGIGNRTTNDLEWRIGYDIHVVRWCAGDDYIQRNAYVAVDLIERYRNQLQAGEKFVIEGGSMGGLVGRYALDYMESHGIPHNVSLFISYDSPQMGAYVPVGVQFAARYFKDFSAYAASKGGAFSGAFLPLLSSLGTVLNQIDRPAPRQMAITYYDNGFPPSTNGLPPSLQPLTVSQGPSTDRVELLKELSDMGDYPKAPGLRSVAIADGAGWGTQRPAPTQPSETVRRGAPDTLEFSASASNTTLTKDIPIVFKIGSLILWNFNIHLQIAPELTITVAPLTSTGEQTVFNANLKIIASVNGLSVDLATLLDAGKFIPYLQKTNNIPPWVPVAYLEPAAAELVDSLKALLTFPASVEHRVVAPVPYALVSGSLDLQTNFLRQQLQKFGTVTGGDYENVFIPTTSALGLDLAPGTDLNQIQNLQSPRFQQIYYSNLDHDHVEETPSIQSSMCAEEHGVVGLPHISSIDPNSRNSTSGGFNMTVLGGNFTSSTVVYIGGKARETTFVSSTELIAKVLSSDIPTLVSSGGPFAPAPVLVQVSVIADPTQPGPTGCPVNLSVQPNALTIEPSAPTTADDVVASYASEWNDSCVPDNPVVSRSGNVFTMNATVPSGPNTFCLFAFTPYTLQAHLGALPAGDYQVIVTTTTGTHSPSQVGSGGFTVQQAAPIITALSPASLPAASAESTITVEGEQFASGQSTVLWNGSVRPTQFVNTGQLQALLSAGDLASPGTAEVSVRTAGSVAPGISGTLPFTITQPVPLLTGLSTSSASQGSPGFTLTANGSYFTASSAVYWADTGLTTRFVNSSTLQADVPASLLTTPGSFLITVATGDLTTGPQTFVVERAGANGPAITSVVNGASFTAGLTRGAIGTLFGSGFGDATVGSSTLPLPTMLGNIQVLVGTVSAPLYYVSATQIDFQVPFETPLGAGSVQVITNGVAGPPSLINVTDYALGVFQYQSGPGVLSPILTDTNYQLISASNPARPGEIIIVWSTGIGALNNAPATGAAAPSSPSATAPDLPDTIVSGKSNGATAKTLFAGLAPGEVGVAQINIQLPATLPAEPDLQLGIRFGGSSGSYVFVPLAVAQ